LTKVYNPHGLEENKITSKQGGQVAGNARAEIEEKTNRPVITSENAESMLLKASVIGMIESVAKEDDEKI
jgi:hypothetical protein